MRVRIVCFGMFFVWGALTQQRAGGQEPKFDQPETPQARTLYEGRLSLRLPETSETVTVSLKDWVVRNRQNIQLPEKGMLVIEMRSGGEATTIVSGQRVERKDGDYFSVRAGDSISLETENETVVLRVLAIER